MRDIVKTWFIQFLYKRGSGIALVNAHSSAQAEQVFRAQTIFHNPRVLSIRESKWCGQEMQLVYEGHVSTNAMNPYELAIQTGFKGTLEEFIESLKGDSVDMSAYYNKEELDFMLSQKQSKLSAGTDMRITDDNKINNEHDYFTNAEINYLWNNIQLD